MGHPFGWHVEGEDGRACLAFVIRAEDGVFKVEDASEEHAGTFSTFPAAITAGVKLVEDLAK